MTSRSRGNRTLEDLIATHTRLRKAIDENDGRLSASSSAQRVDRRTT